MQKQTNLRKIHPKFANEHVCPSCEGYFLDENKDAVLCKTCIKNGRTNPSENILEKDVLHRDVNVNELSKKVAELEATIKRLSGDKTNEVISATESKDGKVTSPKVVDGVSKKEYKPKNCAQCEKEFTPLAPAQKICQDCRQQLIS